MQGKIGMKQIKKIQESKLHIHKDTGQHEVYNISKSCSNG